MPSNEGTLAPPGEYDWTCASFGSPESTTQMRNRSIQPYYTDRGRVSSGMRGYALSPNNCPSPGGSEAHLTHASLDKSESITKRHLDRFSRFCTDHSRVSIYFTSGCPFPLKLTRFTFGIWTSSNTWFFGPTRALNPKGVSIGSAVLHRWP